MRGKHFVVFCSHVRLRKKWKLFMWVLLGRSLVVTKSEICRAKTQSWFLNYVLYFMHAILIILIQSLVWFLFTFLSSNNSLCFFFFDMIEQHSFIGSIIDIIFTVQQPQEVMSIVVKNVVTSTFKLTITSEQQLLMWKTFFVFRMLTC